MGKPKFKVGEWCFCEFQLQQIKRTDEDRITGVTTGFIEMGGHDLSDVCLPLTLDIKRISDSVAMWSRRFHDIKNNGMNYPDLNRALIDLWVRMCLSVDDEDGLDALYKELDDFGSKVLRAVEDMRRVRVGDVSIFK